MSTICPLTDFNETEYLQQNPDVAGAVSSGVFPTGWDHFLLFGHAENRQGTPASIHPLIEQVLKDPRKSPVPPDDLRTRVHGLDNPASFTRLGKVITFDLYTSLNAQGVNSRDELRVLDFGCGCGRVLPWFSYLYPNSKLSATDIDEEAIGWCQANLSDCADFAVNSHNPPLVYPSESFEIIYSISVFTHLPEDMQHRWLQELQRITRPGGFVAMTFHDSSLFPSKSNRARKKLEETGFYYLKGKGTYGLPGFYQNSYHSHAYIHREWGHYFDVIEIHRLGNTESQHAALCQRRRD